MEPTVRDVLAFHRVDRAAYEHLLSLGAGSRPARDAVALLMWLHRRAGVDAAPRVPALVRTPAAAARLAAEARAVFLRGAPPVPPLLLSRLCGGEADDPDDGRGGPWWLLAPGGQAAAEAARRGVAEVLGGVGALVFDDRVHAILRRHHEAEDGGGALPAELATPYRLRGGAALRAAAAPEEEEEDGRSLFITFSKGFPLTREEVEEFFTERWGDCITKVMMEKAPAGELPTYGRVVFRRVATTAAVLAGRPLVKLMVNGRHMWARKYVPRPSPPEH